MRRSGWKIMGSLIGLVKPLALQMIAAISMGVIGYLCAIFLTIFAGMGMIRVLETSGPIPFGLLAAIGCAAVLRGILHYGEQACNHYIAFKLLAIIRHKVFAALRRLAPAKLEGRDKGNLISIITSDIELLEVFYAHTISPIAIAVGTSLFMAIFIGRYQIGAGLVALAGYGIVGILIPLWNSKRGLAAGVAYREGFGGLNGFVLDSLRGLSETIQYGQGDLRKEQIQTKSIELDGKQKALKKLEGSSGAVTGLTISFASFVMLFFTIWQYQLGQMTFDGVVICTIAMMSSFGPVAALSSLSNNLNQTLASGERVLSLLEEVPIVAEVDGNTTVVFEDAECEAVDFSYEDEMILQNYSMRIPENQIVGIYGRSGSGKSTLLKLLMRFWDVQSGQVLISGRDVRNINTDNLRAMESFVTQDTCLFHDSIRNNIAIGKDGAAMEEIVAAAKKASIHEFIESLPQGYDTNVSELGDSLSGGERQRIGIARAFLHDAPLILLDEPTSNLDSLNEGIILKSLYETKGEKTVVLVSHRKSTMNIADLVYQVDEGRVS